MQSSVAAATSHPATSFAGLLAAFADPEKKFPPARDEEGIADDILSLSYEHALRSNARYRPPEVPSDQAHETTAASPTPRVSSRPIASSPAPAAGVPPALPYTTSLCENKFKRASITIRLSQSDCDQLRQRAAEAGLTVSAYLRSCTLEVESLRAQVKETLAQLRSAASIPVSSNVGAFSSSTSSKTKENSAPATGRFWLRLRSRVWPRAKARVVAA